ncbi:MAG: protein kinase [Pirellulaceae bacterium]
MSEKLGDHPPRERLIEYGLGKLDPEQAENLESHLAACESCEETLVDLANDTFADLVRRGDAVEVPPEDKAAIEFDGTPHAAAGEATIGAADGAASDNSGLPRALADHPRYRIVELVGRGGMGDVFRAEHKLMNRPVALKVIKPHLVRSEAAVRRFQREMQAAARLHHGNIVTAFDAEQAGDVHFLVMEYVDGVNLDEVIRQRGRLPVAEACDIIRQAAEGLQHAHQLGMVHRDIKPHNLMVQRKEQGGSREVEDLHPASFVKILDFGLANFANEVVAEELGGAEETDAGVSTKLPPGASLVQLTQMGTMMGTPDYIAPEQAVDAHAADIRADIYSLGCTFYALLTGRAPYAEGSAIEKIKAHAEQAAPPVSNFRDDVPAEVQAVLLKMMAKDPAQRYQTPQEVVEALRAFIDQRIDQRIDERLRDHGPVKPPAKPPTEAATNGLRRFWMLTGVACLLAAIVLAAVIFYVRTDYGVVRVEIADPSLDVRIRGRDITARDGDASISIRPGEHKLIVRRDDFEFETDNFQLRRGEQVTLKVELLDGKVVIDKDGTRFGAKALPPESSVADTGQENHGPSEFFQQVAGNRLDAIVRNRVEKVGGGVASGSASHPSPYQVRSEMRIGHADVRLCESVYNDLTGMLEKTDAAIIHQERRGEVQTRILRYVTPSRRGEVVVHQAEIPVEDGANWRLEVSVGEWPKGMSTPQEAYVHLTREGDGWSIHLDGEPITRDDLFERLTRFAQWNAGIVVILDGDVAPLDKQARDFMSALSAATGIPERSVKLAPNVTRQLMKTAAERGQRMNNLRQVGLALLNYHHAHKSFPPAKGRRETFDESGRPHLSWRVHVLPYLEQQALYERFHLEEPWDSEHNKALLEEMPSIYRTGEDAERTSLLAVVGDGTAYEAKAGQVLKDFGDGTANTAYVVDAGRERAIPWTKPEDLPFNPEDPIRAFGASDFGDVILAVMVDGAVRAVPRDTAPESLRALFTRAGRDTFDPEAKRPPAEGVE